MGYEYTSEDAVKAGIASLTPIYTAWTPTRETVAVFCRSCAELDKDAIAFAFGLWAKTREKPPTPAGIRKLALEWEPPPAEQTTRHGPPDHERIWAEEIVADAERRGFLGPAQLSRQDQETLRTARWVLARI